MSNGININSLPDNLRELATSIDGSKGKKAAGNLRELATSIDGSKGKKADGFIKPDDLLDETPAGIAEKVEAAGYKDIESATKALKRLGINIQTDGKIYNELEKAFDKKPYKITRDTPWDKEIVIKFAHQPEIQPTLDNLDKNGGKYGSILVDKSILSDKNNGYIYYSIPGKKFGNTEAMLTLKYENGKISEIISNVTIETLAVNLELYGNKDLPLLKEITEYLELPKVTDAMKKDEESAIKMRTAKQKELAKITAEEGRWIIKNEKLERTSEVRETMPDLAGTNEVGQGQYGICKFGVSKSQYIQTFGAGPCVIVTLYDPVTKTGLIAHVDAGKDMKASMGSLLNTLKQAGVNPANLQARVIGGNIGESEETISDIYNSLNDNNIAIVEKDLLGKGEKAIILDTKTGKVYDYTESIHDTSEKEMSMIVMQTQTSRILSFNRNKNGWDISQKKNIL